MWEARVMMQFVQLLRVSRMVLRIRVDASSQLVIDVDPAQSEAPQVGTFSTDQLPTSYQLLTYDTRTSEVLCYRKIGSASVGQHTSFSVPLSKQGRWTLIGNDCVQGSAATVGGTPPRAVQKSATATNKPSAQASVVSASSGKVQQGRVPRAANPLSVPAPTTLRFQRTQQGPANISSPATIATVPGISRELFVLRSKAAEMNFDGQQAIKRMRPSFQAPPSSQQIHQDGHTYNAVEAPALPAILTPTPSKAAMSAQKDPLRLECAILRPRGSSRALLRSRWTDG
eukprot:gene29903-37034_t